MDRNFEPSGSQIIHDVRLLEDNLVLLPDGAVLEPLTRPSHTGEIVYMRIPENRIIIERRSDGKGESKAEGEQG